MYTYSRQGISARAGFCFHKMFILLLSVGYCIRRGLDGRKFAESPQNCVSLVLGQRITFA